MKKYKYLLSLLVIIGVFVINSCDESGLEQINSNNIAPETYFSTESQVQSTVNAIYSNFQTQGLYTRHMFFMYDNMSQENSANIAKLEQDKREYLEFSFDASHGAIGNYWKSCYKGINKANFVIGNEEKINSLENGVLSSEKKAKFIGEAKFLRAMYYFLLVTRFGDIPLITEIPVDATSYPRTSVNDVYNQIINDLKDATTMLLSKDVEEKGRATKEAAYAMLGKVYLFRNEYRLALDNFEEIYGDYTLEDNYFDNFKEETEYGQESIFEISYDSSIGGNAWGDGSSGNGKNEITFRDQEYGFTDWFNVYPSVDLLNEYEAGDSRYSDCFYSIGDLYNNGESTVTGFSTPGVSDAAWKKYHTLYKSPSTTTSSGINFKYLRYADVLLMMAECENEVGTQAKAVEYINEVRARPSVNITPITVTSKADVFDAIVHERKVELAGEQVRINDILRWGMGESFLGSGGLNTGFVAGKNELLPIPLSEISSNDKISTADQNPGY